MTDQEKRDYFVERVERLVARRPRSVQEATARLKHIITKKYRYETEPEKLLSEVIRICISRELLDDRAFVSWWITERSYFKPRGRRALHNELQVKGVAKELIDEYFQQGQFDESELAHHALTHRTYDVHNPQRWKEKTLSFLLRRGFSYSIAKKAIEDFVSTQ